MKAWIAVCVVALVAGCGGGEWEEPLGEGQLSSKEVGESSSGLTCNCGADQVCDISSGTPVCVCPPDRPNWNPSTGQCVAAVACGANFSASGGDEGYSYTYELGATAGNLSLTFETYSQQDRVQVLYQGAPIVDTGCVGANGTINASYAGSSTQATVKVIANCAGGSGTAWNFSLGCSCPATAPHRWSSNNLCYVCPEGQVQVLNGQGGASCQPRCEGFTGAALDACNACPMDGGVACRCDQLAGEAKNLCFCTAFGGGAACKFGPKPPPDQRRKLECDRCGNCGDGRNLSEQGKIGDPIVITNNAHLQENVRCLSAGDAHAGLTYRSDLAVMGVGDPSVAPGFVLGARRYLSTRSAGGGAYCYAEANATSANTWLAPVCTGAPFTRTVTLHTETGERYEFDASTGNGPYYLSGQTSTTAGMWLQQETSNGTPTGYLLSLRDGRKQHYDASGQLDYEEDRYGNRITHSYNAVAKVRTLTDVRRSLAVEYVFQSINGKDKLVTLRDKATNAPLGDPAPLRSMSIQYDASGRPWRITDELGHVRTFEYDARDRMTRMYDENNDPSLVPSPRYAENLYAGSTGSVQQQTAPSGTVTQLRWVWGQPWNLEIIRNPGPSQQVERLLINRQKIARRYNLNSTTAYEEMVYSPQGHLLRSTDALGRKIDYQVDELLGLATQITVDPAGANQTTTLMQYDSFGKMTRLTDPLGRVAEYTYCESPLPAGCSAANGALRKVSMKGLNGTAPPLETLYEVNANGQVTATRMPDGTWMTQTYDTRGYPDLTTHDANYGGNTGRLALTEDKDHDWRGFLLSQVNAQGVRTQHEVNAKGMVTAKVVDPSGRAVRTEYTYDKVGNITRTVEDVGTGRLNRVTELAYVSVGTEAKYAVSELREAVGTSEARTTRYQYLPTGELSAQVEVSMGNRTTSYVTTYNADGTRVQAITRPGRGTSSTEVFNAAGQLLSSTDELGGKTEYTYDSASRLSQRRLGTAAVGSSPAANVTYTHTYFADGQLNQLSGPSGYTAASSYDTYGRLDTVTEASSRWMKNVYDSMGRVTSLQKGLVGSATPESRTDFVYDALGRQTRQVEDPAAKALTTTFFYEEHPAWQQGAPTDRWNLRRVLNPNGANANYRYNFLGLLDKTIDQHNSVFQYIYDNLGRLTLLTDGGRTQTWTVDPHGRITSLNQNGKIERWAYRPDGTVAYYCPFAAASGACDATQPQAWAYSYDAATGRLTGINYPEVAGTASADASYTYLDNDLLRQVTDANGVTSYAYDALNRVLTRTRTPAGGSARTLTYAYKANDLPLASLQYWNRGSVSYTTNALGQVTRLTNWAGQATDYSYTSTGQLSSLSANAGAAFTSTYGYDTARRLVRMRSLQGSANLLDLQYEPGGALLGPDNNGNHRTLQESWLAEAPLASTFTYDNLNRVKVIAQPALPTTSWGSLAPGASRTNQLYAVNGSISTFQGVDFTFNVNDETQEGSTHSPNGNLTATYKPGLVILWEGNNSPADSSGHGNGVWTGSADYATGVSGNAFSFNGTGQSYITSNKWSSNLDMASTHLTVDVYVYVTGNSGQERVIIERGDGTTAQWGLGVGSSGTLRGFVRTSEGGVVQVVGTSAVPLNTWRRVTLSYNGAVLRLYVDGTLEVSAQSVGTIAPQSFISTALGARLAGTTVSAPFHGRLDNVRVYKRALEPWLITDTVTMSYDAANRLVESVRDGVKTTYAYDGEDNLVRECSGPSAGPLTCKELVVGAGELPSVLGEVQGTNEVLYAYGPGGLSAQREVLSGTPQSVYYPLLDTQGSVRGLVSPSGSLGRRVSYDAFGAVRASTGAVSTRIGFTGEYTGSDGAVWLRARHYLPEFGRFPQRDSFAGDLTRPASFNRYTWVENAGINATDPTGHVVWFAAIPAAAAVGTMLGGLVYPIASEWGYYEGLKSVDPGALECMRNDPAYQAERQREILERFAEGHAITQAGAALGGIRGRPSRPSGPKPTLPKGRGGGVKPYERKTAVPDAERMAGPAGARQPRYSDYCGHACIANVNRAQGGGKRDLSMWELAKAVPSKGGLTLDQVAGTLKRLGHNAHAVKDQNILQIGRAIQDSGAPAILLREGHYITVDSVNQGTVYFRDPLAGSYRAPLSSFDGKYHGVVVAP